MEEIINGIIMEKYKKKLNSQISKMVSLMNDTKWYKLFEALIENNISKIAIKWVLNSGNGFELYVDKDRLYKNGFRDGSGGPFLYKEIEWIKIYEITEMINGVIQKKIAVDEIIKIINRVGEFEYEKVNNGIKIFGYK
jgi:hypothetical protein